PLQRFGIRRLVAVGVARVDRAVGVERPLLTEVRRNVRRGRQGGEREEQQREAAHHHTRTSPEAVVPFAYTRVTATGTTAPSGTVKLTGPGAAGSAGSTAIVPPVPT